MELKYRNFDHSQEGFFKALNLDKDIVLRCRERIFFSHFANSLQLMELFDNRDEAPKEFTTITGDLQRVLSLITNPLEYEVTLLHFMGYEKMAMAAFSHYKFENSSEVSTEDKLKLQFLKLLHKLKEAHDKQEEEKGEHSMDEPSDENAIEHDAMINRIDLVKKANYNFNKYMELLGHPIKQDHSDVDNLLGNLGMFE